MVFTKEAQDQYQAFTKEAQELFESIWCEIALVTSSKVWSTHDQQHHIIDEMRPWGRDTLWTYASAVSVASRADGVCCEILRLDCCVCASRINYPFHIFMYFDVVGSMSVRFSIDLHTTATICL